MSPPDSPRSEWAPPESGAPPRPALNPRRRGGRLARLFWIQAAATLLLVSLGNVESPGWRAHPAQSLAWLVVLAAVLTLPLVPLVWLWVVLRAGDDRARVAGYAIGGMILWGFQIMALMPYVQ